MTELPLRVALLADHPGIVPVLNQLWQQGQLAGVCLGLAEDPFSSQLENWLRQLQLPYCRSASGPNPALLRQWEADICLSVGAAAEAGPGLWQLLTDKPAYWAIREGETQIRLGLMAAGTNDFHPLLIQEIAPLDTLQSLENRLALQLPQATQQAITLLRGGEPVSGEACPGALRRPLPAEQELQVQWAQHDGRSIAAMARAGNGHLGGCVIVLGNTPLSLLQASLVEYQTFGVPPGTLCHSGEPDGVIVATVDGALRLDVIANADGVFGAVQFAERFQIHAGMAFSSSSPDKS